MDAYDFGDFKSGFAEKCMSNIEKYRKYFTKEYLMGPNSFRLLDELIRRRPDGVRFSRTMDLGCGYALHPFHWQ